ncbi:hypothetical protein [Paenibacillus sp. CMAA1364]
MTEEIGSSATFYQYKLIKKTQLSNNMNIIYWIIPFIVLTLVTILINFVSIFYFILAAPIVLWIHFVVSRTALLISGPRYHKRWSFHWKTPWIGYMPNQFITYLLFIKISSITMWFGLGIFTIIAFWSPLSFIIGMLYWHLWFLLPRLYAIIALSGQRKDGVIKFNPQDISYYKQ